MMLRTQTLFHLSLGAALAGVLACGSDSAAGGSSSQAPSVGQAGAAPVVPVGAGSSAPKPVGSVPAVTTVPAAIGGSGSLPPVVTAVPTVPAAGSGAVPAAPTAGDLPCEVANALKKNCQSCHGASPIGGAPMALTTYADMMKPAYSVPSMKVHELSKQRLNDKAKPMPPGGTISAADLTTLNNWFSAGAKAAAPTEVACAKPAEPAVGKPSTESMEPLVALPGETCYEFKTHASLNAVDNMPFSVAPGEHYVNFYFRAPWPAGSVATRYGARYDNLKVLHHWLMFSTLEDVPEGYWAEAPLPTLNGVGATLLAGWAVGGVNMEMPADVGFELPPKDQQINIQWHYYNTSTTPQPDVTAVQVCTVPAGTRPHTASITWIGTEDIGGNKWLGGVGMPPHTESTFQGTCNPLREGMNKTEPIHIIGFWPHMHQLGTKMQAFVNHKGGGKELIFEKPFDFNHQIHYLQPYELQPGDTLTAVCHYNNTTDMGVPFGESSDTEMCYNFTMAWPAHALENHVSSLIGATNTCW